MVSAQINVSYAYKSLSWGGFGFVFPKRKITQLTCSEKNGQRKLMIHEKEIVRPHNPEKILGPENMKCEK